MRINGSGPRSGTESAVIGWTENSMFYVEVNTTVREGGISSVKQDVTIPLGLQLDKASFQKYGICDDHIFGRTLMVTILKRSQSITTRRQCMGTAVHNFAAESEEMD